MSERVLIVEDEKDVVKLLRMILEEAGYQVFDVSTGESVFEFLETQAVDAILLDIILPGLDGYEVCRRLKTRRQTNMVPIIMLTSRAFHEDIERGLSVGADKYITKPFDHDVLLAEIRDQLQRKRDRTDQGVMGEIEFHIPSDLKYLEQLNEMMSALFRSSPFSEKDITDIHYVFLEMGKNAIEWGNRNRKELPIRVQYTFDNKEWVVNIRDQGSGFDFHRYLDPTYDSSGELHDRRKEGKRSGGLGIMMAKVYMDEIQYNAAGNEVTMIKRFPEDTTSA